MFTYFAHAGHHHEEEASTETEVKATPVAVADAHTEQTVAKAETASTLPIIAGGAVAAVGGVILIGAVFYSLSKKKK